jgi:23S rRNA pseudouridine2605 synthase
LGIASRTQARALIQAGKVRVNGILRDDPMFAVRPETAVFEIDGKRVERGAWKVFLLHKPRSTVTTRSDEKGRPTVFSLLREPGLSLHAVGRLDFATTGLLILTNDTRLSSWLTDSANEVPRVYQVTVRGEVTDEELIRARAGIVDEGELLRPFAVELRKASGKESHLRVELREGKNREIRRLFLALGHEVTRLKRISFGGLELGALQPGEYREISKEEVRAAFPGAPFKPN